MSIINRKAYVYKMRLVPANIFGLFIFIILSGFSFSFIRECSDNNSFFSLIIFMLLYLFLHEILHGVGYYIGGTKKENIQYGICLEKGIFYAMAYQEISKKNILISLQMPFIVIGIITYLVGIIFHFPLLVFLSIINLVGASMDFVMFIYIMKLSSNTTYSESGKPDEFVLISDDNLLEKKNIFFEIVDVRDYHKKDYSFEKPKKLVISKFSYIILLIFILYEITIRLVL